MTKHILSFLLLSLSAFAQTTVTATVQDSNGNPYANGTASAVSVPNSGQPTIYTTPVSTSSSGFFTMTLAVNTYIFTVCAPPTSIGPTGNPTPKQVCFSSNPIAISGGAQNISSTLNVIAAKPANLLGPLVTPSLGALINQVPVEQFGAIGDWNGTSGTDNTVAIQNCINALSAGGCLFQPRAYKISGALSITNSGVGLIGVCGFISNTTIYATPTGCTQIVSSSATADEVDIFGSGANNTLAYNFVRNIVFNRSVVPSGTASGVSLRYTYGAMIDQVMVQDAVNCFLIVGSGSQGTGYLQNSACTWGYNGVTETAGNFYGVKLDSTGSVQNPSFRLRNSFVVSNIVNGVPVFYGLAATGSSTNDLHVNHFETANINYGEWINQTSGTFFGSTDIHFVDVINDGCVNYCMQFNGVGGTVQITGGWNTCNVGCVDTIDIESSNNVSLVNVGMYAYTAVPNLLAHNSGNVTVADSSTFGISATPIVFNGVTTGHISNVTVTGAVGATGITFTSSTNVTMGGTILSNGGGGMTLGVSIDAASHGISGLEAVVCTTGVTTCITDAGSNFVSAPLALNASGAAAGLSGTGACSALSTQKGGSWSGSVQCTGGTAASTLVITPGGTATNFWNCSGSDVTSGHELTGAQSGQSTTTCTLKFSSVTANDVISFAANRF